MFILFIVGNYCCHNMYDGPVGIYVYTYLFSDRGISKILMIKAHTSSN